MTFDQLGSIIKFINGKFLMTESKASIVFCRSVCKSSQIAILICTRPFIKYSKACLHT